MKKEESVLTVYLLSSGSAGLEWTSLLGDKYRDALPFPWAITDELEKAQVVVWDGVVSPKAASTLRKVEELLRQGDRVLVLHREAYSLFRDSPFFHFTDLEQMRFVEVSSGNVLPEDLLVALTECQKKVAHV